MTSDEKTNYLRIGLGLSGVVVNNMTAEIIWRTVEGLQKKKGKFSVRDTAAIEVLVKGKMENKKISLEENPKHSNKNISEKKSPHSVKHKVNKKELVETSESVVINTSIKNQPIFLQTVKTKDTLSCNLVIRNNKAVISKLQEGRLIGLIKKFGLKSYEVAEECIEIMKSCRKFKDSNGRTVVYPKPLEKIFKI